MNWRTLSPALLTLLVFFFAQGLGSVLLLVVGMEVPAFSLAMMAANILAVLACRFFLHNIRLLTTDDVSSINWRMGLLAIVGGTFGVVSVSPLTESIELPDMVLQMSLAMSHNALGLLCIVFIGPVTEELLFREAIEGEMLRRGAGPWMAILVSSLAFSTVHLNLAQGIYALPVGILFGIIYYKTGNVIISSLLHIINNGAVATLLYLYGEDIQDLSLADWFGSTSNAYALAALSGIFCLVLMTIFWNFYSPTEGNKKHAPLGKNAKSAC